MPTIPFKKYLSRSVVTSAVGGRRELERYERSGALKRHYPCSLKRARYLRTELIALLDDVQRSA
jgi:hypothetical protein